MTTDEEYKKMQHNLKLDLLFLLSYTRGLEVELGMGGIDSLKEAFRVLYKQNHGFVEPYKVNVTKYQRILEKEHPELDVLPLKFTGEEIHDGNTATYPFEILK